MTTHTIDWTVEVRTFNDDRAQKQGEGHSYATFIADVLIDFVFSPGRAAVMYGDNTAPAEDPEFEIDDVKVMTPTGHGKPEPADRLTRQIVFEAFCTGDRMKNKMMNQVNSDGERHAEGE